MLTVLRANDFFYGVSTALFDDIVGAFRVADLPGSKVVYVRQTLSTRIFLILSGALRLGHSLDVEKGFITILNSGRFTGEVSMMPCFKPLHKVTATCIGPTRLCWARALELKRLTNGDPQTALNLANSLHARVTDALAALDEIVVRELPFANE